MAHPNLLSPITIGGTTYANRIAMAPMSRGRASASLNATALMAEYYSQRASAGLIFTEGTSISIQGRGWFRAPDVFTEDNAQAWKLTTDAVHARGGKIFCQLWHAGRGSHSSFRTGIEGFEGDLALPVAPSAVIRPSHGGKQMYTPLEEDPDIETPRPLSTEEVEAIVKDFGHAAQTAKDAGFDGVEIHGANGYLIDEFLQSCSNERTDKYGGSFQNRFRFLDEIVQEVLNVFPADKISVRISPNGSYNGMGSDDYRESFLYYAERLKEYNLGILHICIGLGFGFHEKGEPMTLSEFRKVYPGVIMGNVGYTPESAEKEIADGNADMISFGRPYLGTPDLVERVTKGEALCDPPSHELFYSTGKNIVGAEGYSEL